MGVVETVVVVVGFVVSLVVHGVVVTAKLASGMSESKVDREHIKGQLEELKKVNREAAAACKECWVKEEVKRMDRLQQDLRRELPLELKDIRSELKMLKESQERVEQKLEEIEQKLNARLYESK